MSSDTIPTAASTIFDRLAEPFEPSEIKFRPAQVSGNRALALAYVDARVIQDRLDQVLGPAGWQDDYTVLPSGEVTCKLSIRVGDEWICKMDVGSMSEQPDGGDRMKAAFSDALKRAAVKFGIGRFLYRFPMQWVDWDAGKKRFAREPTIPEFLTKQYAAKHARLRQQTLAVLQAVAEQGVDALRTTWEALSKEARVACQDDIKALKARAQAKVPGKDGQRAASA